MLRPGFEPGSGGREPPMLGRTTIGIIVQTIQCSTGAMNGSQSGAREGSFRFLQISLSPKQEPKTRVYQTTESGYSNYPVIIAEDPLQHPVPIL